MYIGIKATAIAMLVVNAVGLVQSSSGEGFDFAATGDWGCEKESDRTVSNMKNNTSIQLVLGLGDYSYKETADCWLEMVDPIDEKMKIAIGNHDDRVYERTFGNESYGYPYLLQEYMAHFDLSEQYYSFDYQNTHFLTISSEVAGHEGSKQYDFVKKDLSTAYQKSTINWIIIFLHNPLYNSPAGNVNAIDLALVETYHPLFDKYGVDLVLQAHNHNYQRSYPLKFNPVDPNNPIITAREKNIYFNPKGQIYLTVGTGGMPLSEFRDTSPFIVSQHALHHGFLNAQIVNRGLTLEGFFYANDGTVKDHFMLYKTEN